MKSIHSSIFYTTYSQGVAYIIFINAPGTSKKATYKLKSAETPAYHRILDVWDHFLAETFNRIDNLKQQGPKNKTSHPKQMVVGVFNMLPVNLTGALALLFSNNKEWRLLVFII